MAINLKPDPAKGWKIMALFDVDSSIIKQAQQHGGIVCIQTNPGLFIVKNATQTFGTIPIKGTAISLAEQHSLGPTSKLQYKAQFEAALKKAMAATPSLAKPGAIAAAVEADDDENLAMAAPASFKSVSEVAAEIAADIKAKPAWKKQPEASIPAASNLVKLKDATTLYQAVAGTGLHSVYHTFAFFPGLKLAARINGTKLSVRAEGENLNAYVPTLQAQFKMDYTQLSNYASAHYVVNEGADLIVKTLAAIVGVIGFQKADKVADLNKFVLNGAA